MENVIHWNSLPSLALHEVFTYLSPESRVAASSTCKHWRTVLYHPLFWPSLALDIPSVKCLHADVKSKVKYANTNLMTLVRDLHLTFDSRSVQCVELALSVVKTLLDNHLLKIIDIQLFSQCDIPKNELYVYFE